jgi:hypothetical protein
VFSYTLNKICDPTTVRDLLTYLSNYMDRVLSSELELIEHELEGVKELTEIESEEKDIE